MANIAYTPDGADHGVAGDAQHIQFVSDALAVDTVFGVGNTIKLALQGFEAHQNNNQQVQLWVGIYSNDGSTLRQTLRNKVVQGVELGTALAGRFLSTTVENAYTTVSGDRLVIEISVEGSPGGGGGVQGHNAALRFGADGAGGDLAESDGETGTTLNPWFEIQTADPAATIEPVAVVSTYSVPTAALFLGDAILSASPATLAYAVPVPSLELSEVIVIVSAVAVVYSTPEATIAGQGESVTPSSIGTAWAVVAPVLLPGPVILTPTAAEVLLGIPTTTIVTGSVTLLPNSVAGTFVVLNPTIEGGEQSTVVHYIRRVGLTRYDEN